MMPGAWQMVGVPHGEHLMPLQDLNHLSPNGCASEFVK